MHTSKVKRSMPLYWGRNAPVWERAVLPCPYMPDPVCSIVGQVLSLAHEVLNEHFIAWPMPNITATCAITMKGAALHWLYFQSSVCTCAHTCLHPCIFQVHLGCPTHTPAFWQFCQDERPQVETPKEKIFSLFQEEIKSTSAPPSKPFITLSKVC